MDKQGFPILAIGFASNGVDVQAGVITRDWNPTDSPGVHLINATIFPDCGTPFARGSIHFYGSEELARKAFAESETKTQCAWLTHGMGYGYFAARTKYA